MLIQYRIALYWTGFAYSTTLRLHYTCTCQITTNLQGLAMVPYSETNHRKNCAIIVRSACKSYGSSKSASQVLDRLDLTVTKGSVYALLGASGSGKTTLLSCLVGNRKLTSGEMLVLGAVPGKTGSASPGPRVGYMPQENALYQELTVWETMKYFGWIAGMSTEDISSRLEKLASLLQINNVDQYISDLSGGEQRRISFAVVLLYHPEVLILDEPTVGLDPLLRESVWEYLLNLVQVDSCTILLTTHYIEEARRSHMVGLMRMGYVVAEAPPLTLLNRFNVDTLEEAFLKLSRMQNDSGKRLVYRFTEETANDTGFECASETNSSSSWQKVRALVWKQFVTMVRNLTLLTFTVLSASISVAIFFLVYGHDPKSITVGVTNYETNTTSCPNPDCDSQSLSCNYVELVSRRVELRYLTTEGEGLSLLERGQLHAFFVIERDYSRTLRERIMTWTPEMEWHYENSIIRVYRDFLAKDIAAYVQRFMTEAFSDFIGLYLSSCNVSRKLMDLPIQWKDPVYGDNQVELTTNGAPAFFLLTAFFVASMVSSTSILIEKNERTYDRIFAMGVGHGEILVSHLITDLCLVLSQNTAMLVVAFCVFGLSSHGSLLTTVSLVAANSFCGMCFGYAIASILQVESTVMHLLSGCMTPAIVLSGTLWPREGMHVVLQKAAWYLPVAHAAHSMNSILNRGWGLSNPNVYLGFVNCFAWITICLIVCVVTFRYKQR